MRVFNNKILIGIVDVTVCGMALLATGAFADTSTWVIGDKKSELDGAQSYVASLQSDEDVVSILNQPKKAILGFSCDSRGFFATISWPDFVQKEDINDFRVTVVWKLDDGTPQHTDWMAATTSVGQAGRNGLQLLKTLSVGHKLIVRVPDKHGGQEATFTLDGIADIYTTLSQRNCG